MAVFARNTDTGVIDDVPLAYVDGLGEVTAVVFGDCGDREGRGEEGGNGSAVSGKEQGKGQARFTHIYKGITGEARVLSSFVFGPRGD